jgi:cell division protein FtsQ
VFSGIASGLAFVLLRQGWTVKRPDQIEVRGSSVVSREQVIDAAGMSFPLPLLSLNPKRLSDTLERTLPVHQVMVMRMMLPPRLRIELVDRQAVARATRRTPKGEEAGYVDREGYWIAMPRGRGVRIDQADLKLKVVGWRERHRVALAKVLDNLDRLGPDLSEIRFEPDGTMRIQSARLGDVHLGAVDDRLERQVKVVEHLSRNLPAQLRGRRPRMIDLTDPDQPELVMAEPASSTPDEKGRSGGNAASSAASPD